MFVANGHHWDARWPEPPFPGQEAFEGEQLHVHDYKTPDVLEGKRVLVLGIGNSATDIAVEASRIAERTFLAMRRGAWILPKYLKGKPVDELGNAFVSRLPLAVTRALYRRALKTATGEPMDYGLPAARPQARRGPPDDLGRAAAADRPRRHRGEAEHRRVRRRADGPLRRRLRGGGRPGRSTARATRSPSRSSTRSLISAPDNEIPLYRRVVSPDHPGLYFIGLLQPLGAIMPLAEAQSEWIADVLEGKVELPSADAHAARDRP